MGLVIDTDVWVLSEKSGVPLNLARWASYGGAYMSAVTASELLVGVERANTAERRAQRAAFVEKPAIQHPCTGFFFACWSHPCPNAGRAFQERDDRRARCADCGDGRAPRLRAAHPQCGGFQDICGAQG